jgi:hypothetical protein
MSPSRDDPVEASCTSQPVVAADSLRARYRVGRPKLNRRLAGTYHPGGLSTSEVSRESQADRPQRGPEATQPPRQRGQGTSGVAVRRSSSRALPARMVQRARPPRVWGASEQCESQTTPGASANCPQTARVAQGVARDERERGAPAAAPTSLPFGVGATSRRVRSPSGPWRPSS